VTLSDESEEEALESEKFLAFVDPHVEEEDSYYSEHSDNEEELKEAYKTLYIKYEKLREGRKQHQGVSELRRPTDKLRFRYQGVKQLTRPTDISKV